MRKNSKNHQILWFVILTYFLAILITILHKIFNIPFISQSNATIINTILWFVYVFSPTISGFIIASITEGKNGIKTIIEGFIKLKVHFLWYFAAILLLLAPLLVGIVFYLLGKSPGPSTTLTAGMIAFMVIFGLISGPVSEEGGWRGFMLPRLESKYNALVSSLILGTIWYAWHIPLYFIEGTSQWQTLQYGLVSAIISESIYFVLVMSISQILTWLYNNTHGSLFITILAHFCFNFGSALVKDSILGLLTNTTHSIVGGILGVGYLVFIFAVFGYKRLSRKPIEELPFKIIE